MGCGVYYQQVNTVTDALSVLRKAGFPASSNPMMVLERERMRLLSNIGVKAPRVLNILRKIIGLSPGVITLWHDVENGFMVEARTEPSSPPVFHLVDGDTAVKVLRHDISPELELFLMTPDENIDN